MRFIRGIRQDRLDKDLGLKFAYGVYFQVSSMGSYCKFINLYYGGSEGCQILKRVGVFDIRHVEEDRYDKLHITFNNYNEISYYDYFI